MNAVVASALTTSELWWETELDFIQTAYVNHHKTGGERPPPRGRERERDRSDLTINSQVIRTKS